MDRMTALETFVTAIETGSFNRAGQRINISQSAVSQQIKSLEQLVGHDLVVRSPKGVRTTEAGQIVYDRAQEILRNYNMMGDDVEALFQSVSGTVRISIGSYLGKLLVGPALIDLNSRYPELDLVIRLEDRLVDVVAENYDLAIRTGQLGDTSGYARKLATIDTLLFAAPSYLERHGIPTRPSDLEQMKFVQFNETGGDMRLTLRDGDGTADVAIPVGLSAASPELIIHAVLNGTGISRAPLLMIDDLLERGEVVPVLPDYPLETKDIHIIYPSRRAMTRTMQTVVTTLRTALAQHPSITLMRSANDA